MVRATVALLFCVFASLAAPLATGGRHDLLAYGALVDDGRGGEVLRLAPLDAEALRGFDAMVRSTLGPRLLQGPEVVATAPAAEGSPVRGIVYFGRDSRAARVTVRTRAPEGEGAAASPGAAAMRAAAERAALAPPAVSAATARLLLESEDLATVKEALAVLARTAPGAAAAEAQREALAGNPSQDPVRTQRRLLAVETLRGLGGAAAWPEVFARLAADADPRVAAAAR